MDIADERALNGKIELSSRKLLDSNFCRIQQLSVYERKGIAF